MKIARSALVSASAIPTALALALSVAFTPLARAQTPAEPTPAPSDAAPAEAGDADTAGQPSIYDKAIVGPKHVDLGHDLQMEVPEGIALFEQPTAGELMEKMGNGGGNPGLLALVTDPRADWMVIVTYEDEGYVKDDDAAKLDPNGLLDDIRQGTEAANRAREKHGIAPVEVVGWDEPPRYEPDTHHLVWAVRGRSEGRDIVNFNTRVLGRKGVASLNLVDDPANLPTSKPQAGALLAATTFTAGARYADYQPGTDKVAEYGLAALVAGGAGAAALKVAKVGLLAKFGGKLIALLIAFKKVVIIAALGVVGLIQKLFGGGKKVAVGASTIAPSDPAA
ncbi:MAG: DUF2167 domain-containing protein [Deltaproteobacteria bacterium]|nr:DUF2167 domain-containing protein [Deltaproteobacteria bacterium]